MILLVSQIVTYSLHLILLAWLRSVSLILRFHRGRRKHNNMDLNRSRYRPVLRLGTMSTTPPTENPPQPPHQQLPHFDKTSDAARRGRDQNRRLSALFDAIPALGLPAPSEESILLKNQSRARRSEAEDNQGEEVQFRDVCLCY